MAITALVQDGKVVDTSASTQSLSATTSKDNSSLDKEAFLQLLVAQMKYQDPLEPTSNTEYISQLATFSSLEEMQNLNSTMEAAQAADLVGKQVIIKVTGATGETSYKTGQVDFIIRENGKTYLSVDNGLYSIHDLDTVVDEDYLTATNMATTFKQLVYLLPNAKNVTLSDKDKVEAVREFYDSLTDYQKQHISKYVESDYMNKLIELEAEMKKLSGGTGETEGGNTDTDGDGSDETVGGSTDA